MENNLNSYKIINKDLKDGQNSSFIKSVFIPFFSGVLGAILVIGTCFGVPRN